MKYLKIDGEFPVLSKSAVTLGKFDGIHRGHKKLVDLVLDRKGLGEQAVLFAVDVGCEMILTRQERADLLAEMGVDILIECPLSEMKNMEAEFFVKEILCDRLHVSYVAVGEDYRFGYERRGDAGLLKKLGEKYGFSVEIVKEQMDGNRKVSSTYIREELLRGNMEKVASLMDKRFYVDGIVEHGRGLGHKVLLPTANLVPEKEKLMPPNGVYVTISHFDDASYRGITNVGYKPTVGETFIGVETYLFGCERDLYGKRCQVEFFHFQRPEQKFPSLEELKKQLLQDAEAGKHFFMEMERK